eukprot:TRINITY_DN5700_c0_g1_i1.p1 TRINITY_DN5700_c0_g1~~TRINITY_DN5700_c0_g1_i1.p1  ORF type:complete len:333 (+),score=72.26 TRINITY_DN5700_c0_g1_i1:132-1001(+)
MDKLPYVNQDSDNQNGDDAKGSTDNHQLVEGPDSIMDQKAHGTCVGPVQDPLKFDVKHSLAEKISCFTRRKAFKSMKKSTQKTLGIIAAVSTTLLCAVLIYVAYQKMDKLPYVNQDSDNQNGDDAKGSTDNHQLVEGPDSIMDQKAHGTCVGPVQDPLKFDVKHSLAEKISCFTRRYAERSGYWKSTSFKEDITKIYNENGRVPFYDSVTGKLLFNAPVGRTLDQFIEETTRHGWPSFRDNEVEWKNVRVLHDGETVSLDGTHLGHNLPDFSGNRYCIDLVSVSGYPKE